MCNSHKAENRCIDNSSFYPGNLRNFYIYHESKFFLCQIFLQTSLLETLTNFLQYYLIRIFHIAKVVVYYKFKVGKFAYFKFYS